MVTLKGICMGAADVIPGVSGGTIAFMTGIYDKLVGSISSINMESAKLLFTGKFRAFFKYINGGFLCALILGVLVSILSLAKLMTYLLEYHPIPTWAFFFGLIVASSIFILKDVKGWTWKDVIVIFAGIVLGAVVCTLSPTQTPDHLWFILCCGAIAICAMILPGISGSFILLILGKYEYIMATLTHLMSPEATLYDLAVLCTFAVGAVTGIIAFSKFLNWLLKGWHRPTVIVLAGFIIGSLVKVWPWTNMDKIISSQFPDVSFAGLSNAESAELIAQYSDKIDPLYFQAVIFGLVGFVLIFAIEIASSYISKMRAVAAGDNAGVASENVAGAAGADNAGASSEANGTAE